MKPLLMQKRRSSVLTQGKRYIAVGLASALLELVIFLLLYQFAHITATWASPISLLCSTALNFTLSKNWSFKGGSSMMRSFGLYIILLCANSIFTSIATQFLVECGLPALFAKLLTMGCVVVWNFFLYRKVVFR